MARTIDQWLEAYAESHQNPTNKIFHWICIPQIMFSLIGLLLAIPSDFLPGSPYVSFASLFLLFALFFYLRLSWKMFAGFLPIVLLLLWGNHALLNLLGGSRGDLAIVSFGIFFVAWVGQFIGHKIEGKKPSFFDDLQFLLIGPAWILHFIYKKMGIQYA